MNGLHSALNRGSRLHKTDKTVAEGDCNIDESSKKGMLTRAPLEGASKKGFRKADQAGLALAFKREKPQFGQAVRSLPKAIRITSTEEQPANFSENLREPWIRKISARFCALNRLQKRP